MKGLRLYLIGGSLLLILYMVAEYNQPKAINWNTTYSSVDKIPFGSYVLYNRLNDIYPQTKVIAMNDPIYNLIVDDSIQNSAVLIVADDININEYDYDKLTSYIKKGNNVFIAANYFGTFLKKKLKIENNTEMRKNGQTYLNLLSKNLRDSTYLVDRNSTNGYFSKFDTVKAVMLGQNGYDHASYIKFPMGKGALFLNANPLMFTNYSLLQEPGASYSAKALSFLPTQKKLIWDEYYTKGRDGEESTMRVFLSHPPLRWAFYLVAFGLLIFVVYQSKRRQRIIPIIPPVSNTSVEFATTVGQVYYEQHDNSNIAQKKVTYFLEYIRQRYNLKTSVLDAEFIQTLTKKSGAEFKLVGELFYQVALIQTGGKVSNDDLITLNHNIEQFYHQSS